MTAVLPSTSLRPLPNLRPMSAEPLLKVQDLSVTFSNGDSETVAAQGVSYELAAGEVLAVVGESGSGKSVVSQAIMGLLQRPARVLGG